MVSTISSVRPMTRYLMAALLCLLAPLSFASERIEMFIRDDVYVDYLRFLNGRSPIDVKDFHGDYIRRDVVDMILVQQALMLGGFDKEFDYRPGKVNFRNTRMLEQGKLLLSFDSYWLADANELADKLYISDAVIRHGEYFAGIFYHPENVKLSKLASIEDFRLLTSVSTPRWRTDWQTLSALSLKELFVEHEWLAQAQMVHQQWADFMLMPLMPSLNNTYVLENIKLVSHPKYIVSLAGSRHFVVSKQHPDGLKAFQAIQAGLQQLRAQGRVQQAYVEAGFIPAANQYEIINRAATAAQKSSPE
ncbi:hypothetical protein ACFOEE_05595 [Pseudoalteromonas fenneropenaei]|uniref:Solute-binding protein family 3/N-terminal domain-containing protein n=1 Tax=Pseudoalteromonas fenneropenaei TaxID=1737459 RepID=A0ABV7CHC1_9GAMM